MATSLVLPGLPTSNGATIIQSNNFVLTTGFEEITWEEALKRVNTLGEHLFLGFPKKKANPGSAIAYSFYERNNMANGNENLSTLVMLAVNAKVNVASPRNTIASVARVNQSIRQWIVSVTTWMPVKMTTTDGQVYHDIARTGSEVTVYMDPETQAFMLPTNGYQALLEAANFVLKPVAASAPDPSPAFKAINGRLPLG